MRVEFVVNSTPKVFYGWLREFTKEQSYAGILQFPFGRDSVHLQPATIETSGDPHSPVVRISLRSHRLIREDDGVTVTATCGFSGTETISFRLVPLDDRRTDVTATCGVPLILPYFRQLLLTIGRKYPEAVTAIELQMDKTEGRQTDWQASFADGIASAPWEGFLPLSLKDVEAACHEHLEYLSGKRFSAEWDVQVSQYVEREGIAIRYDIRSAGRMAGHFRIRWIDRQQTHAEVIAFKYGDDNDLDRLRGVMAIFAARWLSEIPHEALTPELSLKPNLPANMSRDGWDFVNLNSTAGTMPPGMYAVTRSQAKAIGVVNAAIDILKDQFESKPATQPTGDDETSQKADRESPTVDIDDEFLKPIVLDWSVSMLKRWFKDFSDDNGLHLVVSHSPAKGYIDIYKDPFSKVGIKCEPKVDGKIRLSPYVLEGATSEAVGELQQWRMALEEATGGILPKKNQYMPEDTVNVPVQVARRLKWMKVWQVIKPEVLQNHLTGYEIAAKIEKSQLLKDKLRDCPKSGDTLQLIVRAGLAGKLDT